MLDWAESDANACLGRELLDTPYGVLPESALEPRAALTLRRWHFRKRQELTSFRRRSVLQEEMRTAETPRGSTRNARLAHPFREVVPVLLATERIVIQKQPDHPVLGDRQRAAGLAGKFRSPSFGPAPRLL